MSTALNITIAVILAICYNVTLNLSKGIQKWGIEGLSLDIIKQGRKDPKLRKRFNVWLIGSIGTIIATIFQFLAQPYAPNSSFVAAFGGIGLMALVIFSYFVLKENIKKIEIFGIILVMIATIMYGLTASETAATSVDYVRFLIMVLIILSIGFSIGIWSIKHNYKGHAVIWGSIAGFFSGLGISLSQTAAVSGDRDIWGMILTLDFILAILTGNGAFWFTQFGFKRGQATIVVTFYNVFMLITPILVDYFVLGYSIPPIQFGVLGIIGVGIVLLTAFRKSAPVVETPATPIESSPPA